MAVYKNIPSNAYIIFILLIIRDLCLISIISANMLKV